MVGDDWKYAHYCENDVLVLFRCMTGGRDSNPHPFPPIVCHDHANQLFAREVTKTVDTN